MLNSSESPFDTVVRKLHQSAGFRAFFRSIQYNDLVGGELILTELAVESSQVSVMEEGQGS